MRCPDCSKFVSYDELDPESDELNADLEESKTTPGYQVVILSDQIRVALACADCSTELKETSFPLEKWVDLPSPLPKDAEVRATWTRLEFASKSEGKGRGAKTFYGYEGEIAIDWRTPNQPEGSYQEALVTSVSDYEQASSFEELT